MEEQVQRKTLGQKVQEAIRGLDNMAGDVADKAAVLECIYSYQMETDHLMAKINHLSTAYSQGKVPLVQGGHRVLKAVAPPREQRGVSLVENLTEPPRALGSGAVEVDGEPQPALDTSSVESCELLGGANGDEARGRHIPPWNEQTQDQYLTTLVAEVFAECEREFSKEFSRAVEAATLQDFRPLLGLRMDWKLDAINQMRELLRARIAA